MRWVLGAWLYWVPMSKEFIIDTERTPRRPIRGASDLRIFSDMNFRRPALNRPTVVAGVVSVLLLIGIGLAYSGPSSAPGGKNAPSGSAGSQQPRVLKVLDDLRKQGQGRASDVPVKLSDAKVKLERPFAVRNGKYSALGMMKIPRDRFENQVLQRSSG